MAIKKAVYICDCCGEEIDGRWITGSGIDFWKSHFKTNFYKIPGFTLYLEDGNYRSDDLIVCKECMEDIFKSIVEKRNVNFNIDVTTE